MHRKKFLNCQRIDDIDVLVALQNVFISQRFLLVKNSAETLKDSVDDILELKT